MKFLRGHQVRFHRVRALGSMLILLLAVACGTAATPTSVPTALPKPLAPPSAPSVTAAPTPTAGPTAMPKPTGIVSARDSITLVMSEEPITLNPFPTQGGIGAAAGSDNLVDPLTWQSGDDQRIVPTTATTSWEQVAPNKWRFELRKGVKFVNGEAWDAQAALPSLGYQGVGNNDNSAFRQTGGYKAEAAGESTVDITCDQACPIFPRTSYLVYFTAPKYMASATKEEQARTTVSFGPYKLIRWDPGIAITEEAYTDYLPAGDHFEFQKPRIRNVKWVWRGEPTVAVAMVRASEGDIAWDVGVDSIKSLPKEMIRSGSSAEVLGFYVNTLWHPELKKKKVREAMVHAINCKEIADTLYGGLPPCRGNLVWPGVVGATERNTAPYEFNPALAKRLLQEANYNPNNVIKISGRAARIPKLVEIYEAMQGSLKAVGMNVAINVVDPSIWSSLGQCGSGKAVNEVLEAQGRDPKKDKPTAADMQAAIDKGGPNCPTADLRENEFSSENLDYGPIVNNRLSCIRPLAFVCDPSPGGIQDQIAPALAASGLERQRLMEALADRVHDDVLFLPFFEVPVIYAVNPKLNWKPRFDRRVRVSTMWFSP